MTTFDVILSAINGVLAVIGTLENALVIIIIFRYKDLQKGLNLFIFSLSCCDLLVCAFAQPVHISLLLGRIDQSTVVFDFFKATFLHASYIHLIVLTFYRLKALRNPYTYIILVTKKRVMYVVVVIWCCTIATSFSLTTVVGNQIHLWFHTVSTFIFIIVFIRLYYVIKRHRRKIYSQSRFARNKVRSAALDYEKKATKTTNILVGASFLTQLPFIVIGFFGASEEWQDAAVTLLLASAMLHSCVFIGRSEQFQKAMLRALRTLRGSVPQ